MEALPAILGYVVGAILSFLGKAFRFAVKHTWALIVFVAVSIGHGWCKKWKSKYSAFF